ncbi:hypothetical protein ACF1DV_08915 [Streptomyces achromogenes]|uniref:hypothetical protein n=1 Tax=Streptomyces achromogenes TaxID=67255 RepID=UPI0036FDD252
MAWPQYRDGGRRNFTRTLGQKMTRTAATAARATMVEHGEPILELAKLLFVIVKLFIDADEAVEFALDAALTPSRMARVLESAMVLAGREGPVVICGHRPGSP